MKRVGIAALAAMTMMGAFAGTANAGGPGVAPCSDVNALFETANVHVDPLPEPAGSTAGTVVRAVCKVTG